MHVGYAATKAWPYPFLDAMFAGAVPKLLFIVLIEDAPTNQTLKGGSRFLSNPF